MTFLLHFIFIAAFLLIYIIAIIILKPFRIHRKRPVSTIFIKASYLIYLACFLLMAYLILFFLPAAEPAEEMDEEKILNSLTVFSVLAFFIPNIGIMIRRRVLTWRVTYNYLISGFNLVIAMGLVWFILDLPWQFR
ncbi:MAG: hypothetical protein QNK35_02225 [Bacteroides sp.]|nr:hypothetical protein [Bacteroides sp.]